MTQHYSIETDTYLIARQELLEGERERRIAELHEVLQDLYMLRVEMLKRGLKINEP